jgi:hypothetical protein
MFMFYAIINFINFKNPIQQNPNTLQNNKEYQYSIICTREILLEIYCGGAPEPFASESINSKHLLRFVAFCAGLIHFSL